MHGSSFSPRPIALVPGGMVVPRLPVPVAPPVQLQQICTLPAPPVVRGSTPSSTPLGSTRQQPEFNMDSRESSSQKFMLQSEEADMESQVVRLWAKLGSAKAAAARCGALSQDIQAAWRQNCVKACAAATEADLQETRNMLWELDDRALELQEELQNVHFHLEEERLAREVAERRCCIAEFQVEQLLVTSPRPVVGNGHPKNKHAAVPRELTEEMHQRCKTLEADMISMRAEYEQLLQRSRNSEQRLQDEVLHLQKREADQAQQARNEHQEQLQEVAYLQRHEAEQVAGLRREHQEQLEEALDAHQPGAGRRSSCESNLESRRLSSKLQWVARERELIEQLQEEFHEQLQEARESAERSPTKCSRCEARRSSLYASGKSHWEAQEVAQVEYFQAEFHERLQEAAKAEQHAHARRSSCQAKLDSLQHAGAMLVEAQELEQAERQAQEVEQVEQLRTEFFHQLQAARESEQEVHDKHAGCQKRLEGLELQLQSHVAGMCALEEQVSGEAERHHDELEERVEEMRINFEAELRAVRSRQARGTVATKMLDLQRELWTVEEAGQRTEEALAQRHLMAESELEQSQSAFRKQLQTARAAEQQAQDEAARRLVQAESEMERLYDQFQVQLQKACDKERAICQEVMASKRTAEAENGRLQKKVQSLEELSSRHAATEAENEQLRIALKEQLLAAHDAEQRARQERHKRQEIMEAETLRQRAMRQERVRRQDGRSDGMPKTARGMRRLGGAGFQSQAST